MAARRQILGVLVFLLVLGVTGASASAPDVPGWEQVNTSGFGAPAAIEVTALAAFNGQLYAGTANPTSGARIFRSSNGTTWAPTSQAGFGIGTDTRPLAIMDLTVFGAQLYASTGTNENAGQIWRSSDGSTWTPMVITGFGDPDTVDITALAEYNGYLYAGATNRVLGAQIWRSASGSNNTWALHGPPAPGTDRATVTGFGYLGGWLYAAVEQDGPAQVWRTNGNGWTTVVGDGFKSASSQGAVTTATGGIAEFGGYLYVGAGNQAQGTLLWRTRDGQNWEQAITPGFGAPANETAEAVFVFQNQLYVGVTNAQTGLQLWRSNDGLHWQQANQGGFGDTRNASTNRSNAVAAFQGRLYLGTLNVMDGGEVWRMQETAAALRTYLPLVLR